jgi:hypothetical protein
MHNVTNLFLKLYHRDSNEQRERLLCVPPLISQYDHSARQSEISLLEKRNFYFLTKFKHTFKNVKLLHCIGNFSHMETQWVRSWDPVLILYDIIPSEAVNTKISLCGCFLAPILLGNQCTSVG